MNYDKLLAQIGENLCISKGDTETGLSWKRRTVYSSCSRMGLSCLWDIDVKKQGVSVDHYKSTLQQYLNAFRLAEPKLYTLADIDAIVEHIYDVQTSSGCIYRKPYYVLPADNKRIPGSDVVLLRGIGPTETVNMSGAGAYRLESSTCIPEVVTAAFGIYPLQDLIWKYVVKGIKTTVEKDRWNSFEYYSDGKKTYEKHWKHVPSIGKMSVCRTRETIGEKLYYLYTVQNGQLDIWPISDALMAEYTPYYYVWLLHGSKMAVTFYNDGDIIRVHCPTKLPSSLESFLKVYSWPTDYSHIDNPFVFNLARAVFPTVKEVLDFLGYRIQELKEDRING